MAAGCAGRAEVVEALEVAALALPVADGEVDELKLGDVAEVGDGEDGGKDGLKAVILALLGELVHLKETLIAATLNLNEVRNLDGGWDLGKIETAADRAHFAGHALSWLLTSRPLESISPGEADDFAEVEGCFAALPGLLLTAPDRSVSIALDAVVALRMLFSGIEAGRTN
jgi:hypothetical protein